MREIVPGLFTWDWYSERFHYDFHGFFVPSADGNLVVDPVEMPADVLGQLTARGVARIVLTNRNHFRDAARLKAATGARVAVHPADAGFVREKGVSVDDELAWQGRVGPFMVLDAHGKSPGEVALHWPERRLLLVGDACVGPKPGELGLLPAAVIDDAATLRQSLRRLAELDVETLLLADGHSILAGAQAALGRLVQSWNG
jgi:glyoxylase-like metal-dependent hydrolase (beta-lactamase superfamily II)